MPMSRFYSDLCNSWIVNRLTVCAWYYPKRVSMPFCGRTRVKARFRLPFPRRLCTAELQDREDGFQSVRIFSRSNTWNKFAPGCDPKVIVDLGANRGFSTLYWKSRFPDAKTHGVEMDRGNFLRCRDLFSLNHLSATFYHAAINGFNGLAKYRAHHSHTRHRLDSLTDEKYTFEDRVSEVPCFTFQVFLRNAGIAMVDVLKIDIEGAEQFLLQSIDAWGGQVGVILLELHHNIDTAWARSQLESSGFRVEHGDAGDRTEWWCFRK